MHSIDINDDDIHASMNKFETPLLLLLLLLLSSRRATYLPTSLLAPRHQSLQPTLHPAATFRKDRPHYQT
jgi:hypothetical protein